MVFLKRLLRLFFHTLKYRFYYDFSISHLFFMKKNAFIQSLLLLILLASCSHKIDKKQSFVLGQPLMKENFKFTDIVLILKLDHKTQKFESCRGVFHFQDELSELKQMYAKEKIKGNVERESKYMVAIDNNEEEIVIYGLENDLSLKAAVEGCQRLNQFYSNTYSQK